MVNDLPESCKYNPKFNRSLIEILINRYDTGFEGYRISDKSDFGDSKIVRDCFGKSYKFENDYIDKEFVDGNHAGIIVADYTDRNIRVNKNSYTNYPHIIGLYVRKPYRGQGIATKLIDEFMKDRSKDLFVVDCEDKLKSFYRKLNWSVKFLDEFKEEPTL